VRTPSELVDRFRAEGLRVTPQRELIFQLLHQNASHPTADAIYLAASQTMSTISVKTVYQVLSDLRDLGEIQSWEFGTGALRYDPNLTDHHHLVCTTCDAVFDVAVDASDLSLARSQKQGFAVDSVEITYRGQCESCQAG
jgi:Fur family transcriptional regulator, peroxide stress response regulator